jgi:hypothetical protein
MFRPFRRAVSAVARKANRQAHLALEPLESRDCLSNPPVMLSFSAQPWIGTNVLVAGRVEDEVPESVVVAITGVATDFAVPNEDGYFIVYTQASSLGTIYGQALDEDFQTSDFAESTISSAAPVIVDFTGSTEADNVWLFHGRVTDESAPGLVVRLGGIPSLENVTATVGEDGWFTVAVQLGEADFGTATAQTTDWWGLDSEIATCLVS